MICHIRTTCGSAASQPVWPGHAPGVLLGSALRGLRKIARQAVWLQHASAPAGACYTVIQLLVSHAFEHVSLDSAHVHK